MVRLESLWEQCFSKCSMFVQDRYSRSSNICLVYLLVTRADG